jgi:hypothetical protein
MNNRVLTYCLLVDVGIFGVVLWLTLLWGVLLDMRTAQQWSDVTTIVVFAAAHGVLGLGFCLLTYKSFMPLHRALTRQRARPVGTGKLRARGGRRLFPFVLLAVPAAAAIYFGYDIVRNLATGSISICGKQGLCNTIVRAKAPAAFNGAIALESFFAVFMLSIVVICAAMILNGRKQAAAIARAASMGQAR